ncbi:MAG: TolC family protein [Gammaproteobacteria bacterium]|jgi:outer membrane protein TolC|nr:TolC family protein [Gammaproteobacteria bacterium]
MQKYKRKRPVWPYLLAVFWPVTAQAVSETTAPLHLGLTDFVELTMQQSFATMQHQQRQTSQALQLKLAEQHFIPKLSVASQVQRAAKDQYGTSYIDHNTTGIQSTANVNWLLPSGAKLSVDYQYQEGKLTGLSSLGIPQDSQYNSTTTASIEQPVIGGLWHNLNQLPQQKAQLQWQYYQTQGHALALQSQQTALKGFLDFQEKVDQVALLTQALAHTDFRTQAVAERYQEGQTVLAEWLQAQLEQHQRQAALHKAQSELLLIQQDLSAQLNQSPNLRLDPLASIKQLLVCTGPDLSHTADPNTTPISSVRQHPQWQLQQLTKRMAQLDYQTAQFELWPQVALFYNYKQAAYQLQQNTSEQSWGVKASFTPFNTAGKLSKQQLHTTWINATYDATAKHQQLQQQLLLKRATDKALQSQLKLAQQGVNLAQQAFTHAQTRFDHGVDSVLDIKQAQDAWIKQQETELSAIKALLANRFDYYQAAGKLTPYQGCEQ